MSGMKPRQWFQARLRWAVLEQGRGLDHWREAEHIFLSADRETAFQEALRIGYAGRVLAHSGTRSEEVPELRLPVCGGGVSGRARDGANGIRGVSRGKAGPRGHRIRSRVRSGRAYAGAHLLIARCR